jgi:hypothetical protein
MDKETIETIIRHLQGIIAALQKAYQIDTHKYHHSEPRYEQPDLTEKLKEKENQHTEP